MCPINGIIKYKPTPIYNFYKAHLVVYWPTCFVDVYGKLAAKYTSPMDPMGNGMILKSLWDLQPNS